MTSARTTAVIVGALFITGTVAGALSMAVTDPILRAPDYLSRTSTSAGQMVIGALLVLTMGLALALVPVMMYPISRRYSEVLALGYVVFRGALETVTYIPLVLSWLLLVWLGGQQAQGGALDAASYQAMGSLVREMGTTGFAISQIVFPLGALMLYYVLYRWRLIPRWISGWGLVGCIPYLAAGFLVIFGVIDTSMTVDQVLVLPLGVQEMVMAVWLIAKGFSPSDLSGEAAAASVLTLDSQSAR